jgi:hypothetical protein
LAQSIIYLYSILSFHNLSYCGALVSNVLRM